MFSFLHKKSSHPSTIMIDGLSAITNDGMSVETVWQQKHMISTIGDILSKSINDSSDPIDKALANYITTHALSTPPHRPFHTIAFNPHEGVSGNIWHHGEYYLPAVKGMPEHVLEHCDMSDNERESVMIQLQTMSTTGNTIIALATGLLTHDIKDLRQLKTNEKLSFVGFISLQMTVSGEAKRLLTKTNTTAYLATGQHPAAAYAIANQLGLLADISDVFDARRLDAMNVSEIQVTVVQAKIFARATPEHKEHIFDALKANDATAVKISSLADLQKLLAN